MANYLGLMSQERQRRSGLYVLTGSTDCPSLLEMINSHVPTETRNLFARSIEHTLASQNSAVNRMQEFIGNEISTNVNFF